jgi:hypothetical protein
VTDRSSSYDVASLRDNRWTVDGIEGVWDPDEDAALSGDLSPYDDWLYAEFVTRKRCPYCSAALGSGGVGLGAEDEDLHCQLWRCAKCAFWQILATEYLGRPGILGVAAASIACSFEDTLPEGCRQELAQHLTRNPALWQQISATRLEKFVADIFRANYTNAEVIHVGKPGDLGTDIIFIDSERKKWLVQIKGRSRAKAAEGFETLQKLLGTMFLENCQCGIVATTADHFTYHVYEQAGRAAERGVQVKLLDRGKLARMLGPMIPVDPWREHLRRLVYWLNEGEEYHSLERALLEQLPPMGQLSLFDI